MDFVTIAAIAVAGGVIAFVAGLKNARKANGAKKEAVEGWKEYVPPHIVSKVVGKTEKIDPFLEVDYEKKVLWARWQRIPFGQIAYYEFKRVVTDYGDDDDCDPQDTDMRQHASFHYETMRVHGECEELPEMTPQQEKLAAMLDDVTLTLFCYAEGEEGTGKIGFSVDFHQLGAFEAKHVLKPLIKQLRENR